LAQSVVADFKGKVRFAVENYGDSALAKRFGVTLYPAIFVDDILVATPKDFFSDDPKATGRYLPLQTAASHEHFRADLSRMIDLTGGGKKGPAGAQAAPARTDASSALPAVTITDLDGKSLSSADLVGRVVLVEMWATWCPPCRSTLGWLGDLKKRYGDRLAVVTLAVQSEEPHVRKLAHELDLPLIWAIGPPQALPPFCDAT